MYKLPKHTGPIRLIPLSEAFKRAGLSRSGGYRGIGDGTFMRAIRIQNSKASYAAEHETDAIVAARSQGLPDSEVKELVAALHTARANALAELGICRESQAA